MSELSKNITFTDLFDPRVSEFNSPLLKDKRKSKIIVLLNFSKSFTIFI